jgi:hypothetical protein
MMEAKSGRSRYYAAMIAPLRALPLALLALALPAMGAWEELRRNDSVRLSIDDKSIRARGGEVWFRYLVDFRETQGDFKTAVYRSLATRAVIRCKARTISARGTEGYAGNEAKGPMVGVMKPTPEDTRFKKIEVGTSDEDLWKRVCEKAPAKK